MASSRMEVSGFERRTHKRVALSARAELTARGTPESVDARDISMGGLGLQGDVTFAPGARVDVEIRLGEESVRTAGEIVARDGGVAVRFTRLDQHALSRILTLVSGS